MANLNQLLILCCWLHMQSGNGYGELSRAVDTSVLRSHVSCRIVGAASLGILRKRSARDPAPAKYSRELRGFLLFLELAGPARKRAPSFSSLAAYLGEPASPLHGSTAKHELSFFCSSNEVLTNRSTAQQETQSFFTFKTNTNLKSCQAVVREVKD